MSKSQLAVQHAHATIGENEAILASVEEWKKRHQHLFVGEETPVLESDDPATCGICMDNSKDRAFYKCDHRVCDGNAGYYYEKREAMFILQRNRF